ncbi:MAG TPA: lysylphosphatidylglycerol synthase transmembrane domain-containing protein [Coleofasciculaceae cyanobacterium]|jgi:hypothetical protein
MTQPKTDDQRAMTGTATLVTATETSTPEKKRSFSLKQLVKILVSLGMIAFVLQKTGLERTFAELSRANLWYIPIGVAIYLASQVISTYRWQFLAEALGIKRPLRELYDYYLIGMFCNQFLPGAIGGDAVRMFYLSRATGRRKRETLLTILAERGVGLVALLMLTAGLCLLPDIAAIDWTLKVPVPFFSTVNWDIRLTLLLMALCGLVCYGILWRLPLEQWANRFPKLDLLTQAKVYWANLPLLGRSVGISLVVQILMIGMHLLVAQALHIQLSPLFIAVVYGMVALTSVIPLTQGGLGVREFAYQALLMRAGLPDHTALAFGVYWLLISTLTSLSGGLVMLKGHYTPPNPNEADTAEAL